MISHAGRTTPRNDPWRDLRKEDRDEVDYSTIMRRPHGPSLNARLVNLSRHGFMVRIEGAFEQGEQLVISLPVIGEVTGKVAWALGGRVGGQFVDAVDQVRYPALLDEALKPRLRWPA